MKTARMGRIVLALVWAYLGLALVWITQTPAGSYAQDGGIYVDKQLGRTNNVVYVGEYLTFTIYIRNGSAFTVTVLPLADQYNQDVMGYADASIPPDNVDTANGRVDWNDLTELVGDLAPGQDVTVVIGLIAEHPSPSVVNEAAVHDAVNSNGEVVGGDDSSEENESVGGSAPVTKTLLEQAGMVVTFSVEIWNRGYTTLTQALVEDSYDPAALAFFYAEPPPDEWDFNVGLLRWVDLTLYTGDIPPHSMVTVTTVFTTIGEIGAEVVNHASVIAAGDWYSNPVAGGADDVPIVIIDRPAAPTPTPTPTPTAQPPAPPPPSQPTATPQPQPTPTPYTDTPVPTPTTYLILLPPTGDSAPLFPVGWLAFGLLGLLIGSYFFTRRKPAYQRPSGTDDQEVFQ